MPLLLFLLLTTILGVLTSEKSTPETFCEIDIAGFKHWCLLDPECDYSLVPCCLVPTVTLTPVNMDIFAVNGTQICAP